VSAFFAHDSSVIDADVEIGDGTKIWHFCHVSEGARIGADVSMGQNVFVGRGVHVGNTCRIQNNVSIYEGVTLEEGVFCGPSMVFTNADRPRAEFPLGSANFVKTLVQRGATLGANSTIVCGVTLGAYCFVGAGAVVTQDVPAHALMVGVPAKQRGWACMCGAALELQGGHAHCDACGRSYTGGTSVGSTVGSTEGGLVLEER
jgi:UDP-2-acetamido-3-amino-2,3-dideoxy-glucuronate N-acetyltransferase